MVDINREGVHGKFLSSLWPAFEKSPFSALRSLFVTEAYTIVRLIPHYVTRLEYEPF
jgi:hypothetical protein